MWPPFFRWELDIVFKHLLYQLYVPQIHTTLYIFFEKIKDIVIIFLIKTKES